MERLFVIFEFKNFDATTTQFSVNGYSFVGSIVGRISKSGYTINDVYVNHIMPEQDKDVLIISGIDGAIGGVIGGGVGGAAYVYGYEYSLSNALLLVLISGVVFLLFSVIPIGKDKKTGELLTLREKIYDGMPKCLTKAIPVGIGFFIAF